MEHDPLRFSAGLSAKLATRSRHVCAFLGAGVARACGLPDVAALQSRVLDGLKEEYKTAFNVQLQGRTLEQALSRLRRIRALLTDDQTVDGLTSDAATKLDVAVCNEIVKSLDVSQGTMDPVVHFAAWAARANYHAPIEIFTVNYDLLIETALEQLRVPYFDGFVGALRAHFQTEMVEATSSSDANWVPSQFVRIWKLHGSVNWEWDQRNVVRVGQAVTGGAAAAIYPSDTKYEDSRRVPFIVLQDRFRRALHAPETVTIVSGYSFGDDHLNEMLFDAAARRERSEIIVFCYADIPEVLANRARSNPNLQAVGRAEAILGGIRGPWKPTPDVSTELWADGQFTLPDFSLLASFLARSIAANGGADISVADLQTLIKTLAGQKNG